MISDLRNLGVSRFFLSWFKDRKGWIGWVKHGISLVFKQTKRKSLGGKYGH